MAADGGYAYDLYSGLYAWSKCGGGDAEGRKQVKRSYINGTLTEELIYTTVTDEDGWMSYPGTVIAYETDGSKTVTEYDENDNVISVTTYDAAGNEIAAG